MSSAMWDCIKWTAGTLLLLHLALYASTIIGA